MAKPKAMNASCAIQPAGKQVSRRIGAEQQYRSEGVWSRQVWQNPWHCVSWGGKNINLEMLEAGFAEVYRGDPAPVQDLAPYWKAEEKTKTAERGMWLQGEKHMSPREWRKLKTR